MKLNRMDLVTDLAKERLHQAFGEAREQFKNTNPYRQEPVSWRQQLYDYKNLTQDSLNQMIQEQGIDKAKKYVEDMEALKAQRGLSNA